MAGEAMIRGIIELYLACHPDTKGRITQASFQRELGNRLPDAILTTITKLFDGNKKEMLSFIDFWSLVEHTVSSDSSLEPEDDDLVCLRFLRDKVLGALSRKDGLRSISHGALIDMLTDVRNKAVNKSAWDEALRSSKDLATGPLKSHSVDTISSAIKVMLDEYLAGDIVAPEAVDDRPLDELRTKLTESECNASQLKETNSKYAKEIAAHASELASCKSQLSSLKAENDQLRAEMAEARFSSEKAKSLQESITSLQSLLAVSKRQQEALKVQLSEPPTLLLSQIQTLEVQKSDAEIEVTRLQKVLAGQDFVGTAPSSRTPSTTVSVYGQPSNRTTAKRAPKREPKRQPENSTCIQQ